MRPRILQRHLDLLRQTRIDPYRWRYRVIADGDMQRVGEAALHALDEPQGSGEQDEEEEGEQLAASPLPPRALLGLLPVGIRRGEVLYLETHPI